MAETTQLEKFLAGTPLNEDLETLAAGNELEPEQVQVPRAGALTDDDREHLRRLKYEPGFPILLSLLDEEIAAQRKMLESASMEDPLGNRDKIAEGWAYIAMQKRVRITLVSRMDAEIQAFEDSQKKDGR